MTTVVVTAAVIERRGSFLLTRRLEGTHLAGAWEFPGGKCHDGEALEDCMVREIEEELGVECRVRSALLTVSHEYPERRVELHFFECELGAEPRPMLGQEMQWVERARLGELELPPADAELIALLQAGSSCE